MWKRVEYTPVFGPSSSVMTQYHLPGPRWLARRARTRRLVNFCIYAPRFPFVSTTTCPRATPSRSPTLARDLTTSLHSRHSSCFPAAAASSMSRSCAVLSCPSLPPCGCAVLRHRLFFNDLHLDPSTPLPLTLCCSATARNSLYHEPRTIHVIFQFSFHICF